MSRRGIIETDGTRQYPRIRVFVIIAVFSAVLALMPGVADASPKGYKGIAFKGLSSLSKESIIRGTGIYMKGNVVVADNSAIEDYLRAESLVKSYKLIDKNNRLLIVVEEKNVRCIVGIRKDGICRFMETDESFSPVSRRIHRSDVPVVIVSDKDVEGNSFTGQALRCLTILERLRKSSSLWREIESVELLDDGSAEVTLRGRPTIFNTSVDDDGFARVGAAAGWCDRSSRWPVRCAIREEFTVIR